MLSQLFVLSPRGDTILKKEFRYDVPKVAPEVFFRAVKFWKDGEKAPAVFNEDGVNYLHVKVRPGSARVPPHSTTRAPGLLRSSPTNRSLRDTQAGGLYYAATTRKNVSPSHVLELLHRVARVFKDYCGVASEDALRKNAVLAYELLDEMVDYGYAQSTSTDSLRAHVFNEPTAPASDASGATGLTPPRGKGSSSRAASVLGGFVSAAAGSSVSGAGSGATIRRDATQRSVIAGEHQGGDRDEIFVDVVEKLNVTFNASGHLLTSEIDGQIQMRNFLRGEPKIRVALPEDLAVGGRDFNPAYAGGDYGYGVGGVSGAAVLLDDCNFHESADLSQFDSERTIEVRDVPRGEFALMNYRAAGDFNPPFKVTTLIDETTPYKITVTLRIRAEFPSKHAATGLAVKFPVPKRAAAVHATVDAGSAPGTQHAAYAQADRQVVWQCKKMTGGSEHALRITVSLNDERLPNARGELGPASLGFTIPMYNVSRVRVRYLQIGQREGTKRGEGPHRWVRYVTKSSNYVARV